MESQTEETKAIQPLRNQASKTKVAVAQRRQLTIDMVNKGLSQREIAKAQDIALGTVVKDLKEIREELGEQEVTRRTAKDVYVDMLHRHNQRLKRLWELFSDNTTSKSNKLKALEILRTEDNDLWRKAQIIGIIPRDLDYDKGGMNPEPGTVITQVNRLSIHQTFLAIAEEKEKMDAEKAITIKAEETKTETGGKTMDQDDDQYEGLPPEDPEE